jgi:hypothetical protein
MDKLNQIGEIVYKFKIEMIKQELLNLVVSFKKNIRLLVMNALKKIYLLIRKKFFKTLSLLSKETSQWKLM